MQTQFLECMQAQRNAHGLHCSISTMSLTINILVHVSESLSHCLYCARLLKLSDPPDLPAQQTSELRWMVMASHTARVRLVTSHHSHLHWLHAGARMAFTFTFTLPHYVLCCSWPAPDLSVWARDNHQLAVPLRVSHSRGWVVLPSPSVSSIWNTLLLSLRTGHTLHASRSGVKISFGKTSCGHKYLLSSVFSGCYLLHLTSVSVVFDISGIVYVNRVCEYMSVCITPHKHLLPRVSCLHMSYRNPVITVCIVLLSIHIFYIYPPQKIMGKRPLYSRY